MIITPFVIGIGFIFLCGRSYAKAKYLNSLIFGILGFYFIVAAIGAR